MYFYHGIPDKFLLDVHEYPVIHGIENGEVVWKNMMEVLSDMGIYNVYPFLFLGMEDYFENFVMFDEDTEDKELCRYLRSYLDRRGYNG